MSIIEIIGVLTALLYLVLAMRESPWCWVFAVLSSICYMVVFYHAQLFTEVLLQIFFILIAVQGFLLWRRDSEEAGIPIHFGAGRENLRDIGLCFIITIFVGELTSRYAGAPLAVPDAAITIFSMYATVLVKRKRIENWLYWIVIDSGAAVLYGIKELYLTAGLFILYVFLAIIGYRQWKSRMN